MHRHILITGCDSGFGYALAKRLDEIGVPVFASCLSEVGEEKLRKQCSSRLKTLRLDVTSERFIEQAVEYVTSSLPKGQGLWGLVNNAGIQNFIAPLELQSNWAIEKTLQVNLLGMIYVTKAFLPLLRHTKGRIVNVSSIAASLPWPCRIAYNISKCGINSASSCLRKEMYHVGVTVHCVEPGAFKTNIINSEGLCSNLQKAFDEADLEIRNFYGKKWLEARMKFFRAIPGKMKTNLLPVTEDIEHALFAQYPRTKYRCGNDCKYKFWPISILNDWFSDWYYAMQAPDGVVQN